MKKRLIISLIAGAILGIFCIIGARIRMGETASNLFLFSTWFNRIVLGLAIGLYTPKNKDVKISILRGGTIGLIISFSLFTATNFIDIPGFIAGIVYGIIIDFFATKYDI